MTQDKPLTGWHVFAMMAVFFAVIIAVNLTMAMKAGGTWTGLVVKNSYVASQQFNERLAESRAQKARGWRDWMSYRDGRLSVRIEDAIGRPVQLEVATLSIGRPSTETADRVLDLTSSGVEMTATLDLAPGIWSVIIQGQTGTDSWRREARILISATGQGYWQ